MAAAKDKKEKTEDPSNYGHVNIAFKDVDAEREAFGMASAGAALKSFHKGEVKHFWQVAEKIKRDFDEKYEGKWHVIVGKEFGSFVTHESRT